MAFSPCMSAGRKSPWCALRCKKFLQNSRRDSRARDTSFPAAEEVRVFSCAFDSKSITTVRHTARIHKCSLGILQQLFNNRFWFASVRDLGIDHTVTGVVSTEHATSAKLARIFACRAVAFARLGMNEDRSSLGIWIARWNCRIRKQDHALAGFCETQTMPARITSRRICDHDRVVCCSGHCCAPGSLCDFSGKRNNPKR